MARTRAFMEQAEGRGKPPQDEFFLATISRMSYARRSRRCRMVLRNVKSRALPASAQGLLGETRGAVTTHQT